ncbi:hypothetical protein Rs2_17264 [Raphanus sativus]|uniref:Uncharacterized protein LOC108850885 n=1 Tax=Raphanus sativus TaxID=3726 RepID=A0A6J0N6W8_RAPSA|nr:uncharacterized protein LOC108850885 [Raphanus sativus]KAJ4903313.1 hypothetical protein Rs2_17264 [Raphanus sativus]
MASFLEKATSAFNEAKESATSSAESVSASLTDVQKTVAASTETVKTDSATAPEKVFDGSTQTRDAVEDNATTRDTEGAKSLLHVFDEKRAEVSSKLVGAVTNASDGASSNTTVASRELLVSTDNQPLLATGDHGVETTTCWKECCGVLELMAAANTRNGAPRR